MSTRVITIPLSISNAYLLLGDRPVLVDAGSPGDDERLVSALSSHGVRPEDLALIALTHGHADHAGAVGSVATGGAPIAIGAADAPLLHDGRNGKLTPTGPAGWLLLLPTQRMHHPGREAELTVTTPLRLDAYGVAATMLPVGAHTPGSCAILVDEGEAIVGDMIRGGFASGRIRPGHPLRHYYTEDRAATPIALRTVLASDPTAILVGHGGPLSTTDVSRRFDALV